MHAKVLKNPHGVSTSFFENWRSCLDSAVRKPLDPGKHDMVYYKEWSFVNGASFQTARIRLLRGMHTAPKRVGENARLEGWKWREAGLGRGI
jgi:hypothetical protein